MFFPIDIGDLNNGYVKGTTAQVIHGNFAIAFFVFVQTKGQRGSSGFVDDTFDVQAGNAARVFGGLTLSVVEISRNGDDRVCDFFAKVVFGGFLHFAKNVRADLLGGHAVSAYFNPSIAVVGSRNGVRHQVNILLDFFFAEFATNQALNCVQGVAGVGNRLALGRCTDQDLTVFLVRNDGGRGARAFSVLNDLSGVAFHDGHTAVGGA